VSRRVALLRSVEDAGRSAEVLRRRGFEPVLAPVTTIRATGARPPGRAFDAVLATSANAFARLSAEARAELGGLKLYVAGERTAAAAGAAGFPGVEAIAPDATGLAGLIAMRLPRESRLLYLAGRNRKGDLEAALAAASRRVLAVEVYVADARPKWSAAEALAVSTCQAVLHYSRRSADLARTLAERAGLGDHFRAVLHVCISQDAAEPLRGWGAARTAVASAAQEPLLLDALEAAIAAPCGGR
jgi:uroporphyrinogen-III synthase